MLTPQRFQQPEVIWQLRKYEAIQVRVLYNQWHKNKKTVPAR